MIPRFLAPLTLLVAVSVAVALLLVLPGHHGLDGHRAFVALAAGLLAALGIYAQQARREYGVSEHLLLPARRFSAWGWLMFTAFALFGLRAYCWLSFHDGDDIKLGSPNNLGDLSLHLMLSNYFAHGTAWWPDHPQHAWVSMRYYPGIDLFQALLNLAGADESCALVWVGLIGTLALALALYEWGGSFAMAGFLFSGGLAGFQIFRTGLFEDYQGTAEIGWKSLPLAIFITQRPFLFALPAGLLLMAHWRKKFFAREAPLLMSRQIETREEEPSHGLIPFWAEVLLYAVMPMLHLFTFVFLSLLLGWWFLAYFSRASMRQHLLWIVGITFVPAVLQVALMTSNFGGGGMTHWADHPWMRPDGGSFLGFWLLNFGLFAPLAIVCWLRCVWKTVARVMTADETGWITAPPRPVGDGSELAAEAFVIPAGIIFIFSTLVMLTPWEWDNTKLMLWCYVAALPFLWQRWIAPLRLAARLPICAALFFSGFVCVIGGLKRQDGGGSLAKRSELDAVSFAVKNLPAEARFAAAPEYNHPLVFSGRKVAMGYVGHLFSQGLDYTDLKANLDTLMHGRPEWGQCAGRLGVRYLYWGKREEKAYPNSHKPWETSCQRVASGDWGSIYDLQQSPVPQ